MTINNSIVTLQEDEKTGNLFFELPVDALNQLGWDQEDVLEWFDNADGTWTIQKKVENSE
jgi:hypothetical protein